MTAGSVDKLTIMRLSKRTDKCKDKLPFIAMVNGSKCNIMEAPEEHGCSSLYASLFMIVMTAQVERKVICALNE